MKIKLLSLIFILLFKSTTFSQTWPTDTIQSSVNTGNPQFPFPQFMEYTAGKTLATYNAEGVTHADMEKTMMEGYKMMMHRCLYTGKVLNGKKYIVYNHSSVPYNYNTFVSEGDGYALLAAAYFADKDAFDGLWLWIHDNRMSKVKKYYDCTDLRNNFTHGANMACWYCDETTNAGSTSINSASDGDFDIAMALLIATAQWGEQMGINDACGSKISYKNEALQVIKSLVDTVYYSQSSYGFSASQKGYLSGDIGIDGYVKNGNAWGELTSWRTSKANEIYAWAKSIPDPLQSKDLYTDYISPAYFNEFAKYLKSNGGTQWQINQFKRAEASSDWLIGQLYDKGYIASSGKASVSDSGDITTFGQHPFGPGGKDFRASWRTILNYVWHGNPDTKWDPAAHAVVSGGNTSEKDMGIRHASFLKYPRTFPSDITAAQCEVLGSAPDLSAPLYKGVVNIKQAHLVTGAIGSDNYRTNFNVGTGAVAAVASGDIQLTGDIFRQSELLWDDVKSEMPNTATEQERYYQSTPKYFHDWFRLLGMLTTSGNLQPFGTMTPAANLKVYMSVDKTYAKSGDFITYSIHYRNYGSVNAADVTIRTEIGNEYEFIEASNGGASSGKFISWKIGEVLGFTTAGGVAASEGTVKFTVKIKNITLRSRACITSTIKAYNSSAWTSNEYPNNATYTMEKNCVDLLPNRALNIAKTSNLSLINAGDSVSFKLQFENTSSSGLTLDGGRDNVVLSYGTSNSSANSLLQNYRIWHSAPEAYINLGNYRVSYFMKDTAAIGLYNATTNPTGWTVSVNNQTELEKYFYNPVSLSAEQRVQFSSEKIPADTSVQGNWNQKFTVRFANVLSAPAAHLYDKIYNMHQIHKGVIGPAVITTEMKKNSNFSMPGIFVDDWSYSSFAGINTNDARALKLFPISNSWANIKNPDLAVTNFGKDVCNPDVNNFKKILVEEFDGYTWRRIAGSSPVDKKPIYKVVVVDTIPRELAWDGFINEETLGAVATYTAAAADSPYTGIVKWTIPAMTVGMKGELTYNTIAKVLNPSCPGDDRSYSSAAYIASTTEKPNISRLNQTISCILTSLNSDATNTQSLKLFYSEQAIWIISDEKVAYQIFDSMGKNVSSGTAQGSIEGLENLSSGVYYVNVNGNYIGGKLKFLKL